MAEQRSMHEPIARVLLIAHRPMPQMPSYPSSIRVIEPGVGGTAESLDSFAERYERDPGMKRSERKGLKRPVPKKQPAAAARQARSADDVSYTVHYPSASPDSRREPLGQVLLAPQVTAYQAGPVEALALKAQALKTRAMHAQQLRDMQAEEAEAMRQKRYADIQAAHGRSLGAVLTASPEELRQRRLLGTGF